MLALLFALVESSRKYDKYREWPYLVIAIGYFLLLIWSLFRAMMLQVDIIQIIMVISKVAGLLALSVGYITQRHHEDTTQANDKEPVLTKAKESEPVKKSNVPWVTLLSAQDLHLPEQQPDTKDLDEALSGKSDKTSVDAETDGAQNETTVNTDTEAADQTNVQKTDDKTTEKAPETEQAAISPSSTTDSSTTAPEKPKKTKKVKFDGPVDLSYLAQRKPKKKSSDTTKDLGTATDTSADPIQQESREQIMDELFPVQSQEPKSEPLADKKESAAASSSTVLPGEHRDTSKDKKAAPSKTKPNMLAAGVISTGISVETLLPYWPHIAAIILMVVIITELSRNIKSRGTAIQVLGFTILTGQAVWQLLWLGPITESIGAFNFSNPLPLISLTIEAIGFILIGVASWMKIKGKITQHFLTVISIIYLVFLILTVGLAKIIVKDAISLQLLILLTTGTLIALLPIVHSLSFSHPAHTKPHEGPHE